MVKEKKKQASGTPEWWLEYHLLSFIFGESFIHIFSRSSFLILKNRHAFFSIFFLSDGNKRMINIDVVRGLLIVHHVT